MSEEILTAERVAAAFKLSPKNGARTVIFWAQTGRVSFMKLGRLYRFRMADVLAYGYKMGSGGEINKRYLGHR